MDDLGKQFKEFYQKTKQVMDKFPVLAAATAENFFHDSFNQQAWSGEYQEVWPKRKTDKNKRDRGRAILTKTSRLNRSIHKMKADWTSIIVGTNLPYAAIHNEGFNGTENVSQHYRIASRKVSTRYLKNGSASKAKNAFTRVMGKGHEVKAHSRHMVMPRRKYIGNSPYLDKKMERVFLNELKRI